MSVNRRRGGQQWSQADLNAIKVSNGLEDLADSEVVELIETGVIPVETGAIPGIEMVLEDNPLVEHRASGKGMTLKGNPLIAALKSAGVDWRKETEEQVAEVPTAKVPNDFVLRDTRVKTLSPVVKAAVKQDIPLESTGNSILGKIINGEQWELKDGRWQPALPTEDEVYGTNVNYDYNPEAEGDIDGPRMVVAEDAVNYGSPKATIIEQIVDGPPKNWKDTRLPEAATQRRRGSLRARFMTDAAREALTNPQAEGIMAAIMEGRRAAQQNTGSSLLERQYGLSPDISPPVLIKDPNALSPDGIRYYEQPVEVEMAQVMPENVPQRSGYRSMILDDLRQQALNNIDSMGADDMRMGPMLGNIPSDRIRIMPMEAPIKPTYKSMILEDLRQKALDDMNRVAVADMPVETIIDDADNPRLAGTLLQDPRVRLGLAGAGGAGLLAVIAHNIGQNREARRQEAQRNLNYPIGYDNGY
jgi:hypothetical protein